MGWFGMSHDDMDENTWKDYLVSIVNQVREENPEATAIVVDCHV